MRRDLKAISTSTWDVLIIGGGITGASILRDAALRGLRAVLFDKNDFSCATSSATSKLVHGGLRYLKNLEFGLIRESLRERRIWEFLAPHLVYPLPFLVPTLQNEKSAARTLDVGLTLYDALSYDRRWLADRDQRVLAHRRLSQSEALEFAPVLEQENLAGAMEYYDCQMYAPERLGFESIADAVALGAAAANHAEIIEILRNGSSITGARVRCSLSGEVFKVNARTVINAAGPWADSVHALADPSNDTTKLIRSKGIHLIVRKLTKSHAVAVLASHAHFFVLPWRGHTILGTTDSVYEGSPDAVHATGEDISGLLQLVNAGLPAARLTHGDIVHIYCGLRPLVDDSSKESKAKDSYSASRRAEIRDHASEGADGLLSTIGGKWTTSRHIAQRAVDIICRRLGKHASPCRTHTTPLEAGRIGNFKAYLARARQDFPQLPPAAIEHLARTYGAKLSAIGAIAHESPEFAEPLSMEIPSLGVGAQIVHAARSEMALTLEDALLRRTGLGTLRPLSMLELSRAASLMARELHWSDARAADEVASMEKRYRQSVAS